ncbi:TetR/AcrR family transcriptional regulator [Actinosynnema pretiosum]|uniref:TetR family transcriptional regulator n=1 Tax=Actinosynnema pretiosum TaxID=42197 RepID=A0A290Z5P0_9PSEU|nr:TetR/AcrR family transcriptional regulator [Actinosynnema pretiosum]ATE54340.1 TetR family transcriptional regulator [Actinosynnema pretiosum]
MPRPTKHELDAEIIDSAARLFARHGFEHTSLQQLADAVGYTKAGLLHHYPSKKALYRAVLERGNAETRALLARIDHLPPGEERDRAAIVGSVQFTIDWPGLSMLSISAGMDSGPVDQEEFVEMGRAMLAIFCVDPEDYDVTRFIRLGVATAGLMSITLAAVQLGAQEQWRDRIVATAMAALGHGEG